MEQEPKQKDPKLACDICDGYGWSYIVDLDDLDSVRHPFKKIQECPYCKGTGDRKNDISNIQIPVAVSG